MTIDDYADKSDLHKKAMFLLDQALRLLPPQEYRNFTVGRQQLVGIQVCSSVNLEDLTAMVNEQIPLPDGVQWFVPTGPLPVSGDPPINKCDEAEAKKHYVFVFPEDKFDARLEQIHQHSKEVSSK